MTIAQVAKGTRVRVLTVPGVDYWRSKGDPRPESGAYTGYTGTVVTVHPDLVNDAGDPDPRVYVELDSKKGEFYAPAFYLSPEDIEEIQE